MCQHYELFTDGSCHPDKGNTGGWAWVFKRRDQDEALIEKFGGVASTSSSNMEWLALVNGILALQSIDLSPGVTVTVYSDFKSAIDALNTTVRKRPPKPVILDVKETCKTLKASNINVVFEWIPSHGKNKSHPGSFWNQRADTLAAQGASDKWQALLRKQKTAKPVAAAAVPLPTQPQLTAALEVLTRTVAHFAPIMDSSGATIGFSADPTIAAKLTKLWIAANSH